MHALFAGAFLVLIASAFTLNSLSADTKSINGTWKLKGKNCTAIISDGYFSQTTYNKTAKTFDETFGGKMAMDGKTLTGEIQFSSKNKEIFGQSFNLPAELKGNTLTITQQDGSKQEWERMETGSKNLAGVWRITQRENEGKMSTMPLQARRTLKIMSDGHFQWIAINIETGEFLGTGGGTYTFTNGKYTENIEFFSRDNSRVGASLMFDDELKGSDWHHKGKSSKGDPIYEVWSRFDASK